MFEARPLGLGRGVGVIDMELLSVIRRWRYRDHYSIREISRRTGLSRNTVRKYLRSDSVEPKFRVPDRPSKLDPYADKLSHMLRQETGKSRKQKRTIKQLYVDLGYDGSYNRVAAFARLDRIIEVVLVAEEALYGNNVLLLEDWVRRQPPWSDQPFVVLTNHNEGPKFAAFRRELVMRLRNVGFLERPLQALNSCRTRGGRRSPGR